MIYHDDMRRKRNIVAGGALLLVILVSVLLYVFRPAPSVQRVIFFPDETSLAWSGELREIPRRDTRESEVEYLTREIILGPTLLRYGRAIPRDTILQSLLLRDGVLYVSFSEHMVLPPDDMLVDFEEMLDGYKKTIAYNYRKIDVVRIFIDGIEIVQPESQNS